VNTPDILHESLQVGGPGMFALRATLAATLSPTWGVYSGFELYEHEPVRPGSEEYLNSEKYELRPRDYAGALADGRSLQPWLGRLNEIRRAHPALQQLRTLRFHHIDNDALIAYSKQDPETGDTSSRWSRSTRSRRRRALSGSTCHRSGSSGTTACSRRRGHRRDVAVGSGQLRAARTVAISGARRRSTTTRLTDAVLPPNVPASASRGTAELTPDEVELVNADSRPDAALGSDGVPHTGEAITPDGMLIEPQAEDFRSAMEAPGQPEWFKGTVFYEVLVRAFSDSKRRWHRRPAWPGGQAGYLAVAGRGLSLAAALLRVTVARRWLRHQ